MTRITSTRRGIRNSILETIGHTPVVRINRLAPEGVELFVKIEAFNPMGSVKDRLALGIIEAAEADGTLKPGQTVVEATSGNTGIGLAMVCAQKGYPLVVTMAESFSVERRRLMRFLGARVVLTPANEKGTGMVAKARQLAEAHGWFLCRQFENEANANIHSMTTAEEILSDFPEDSLDYFVTGAGTGGTLKGVARVLRAHSPKTVIVAAEPDNASTFASGIMQRYNDDGTPSGGHPAFVPHVMQGWTPDFIPKHSNDAFRSGHVDRVIGVSGDEALRLSRELARREGIFCGITAGATFAAALEVARTAPKGSKILAMLPDTGERYLSTPLFADIGTEMDDEERAIAESTPGQRMGGKADPATAAAEATPSEDARRFVAEILKYPETPVTVFALEWCEFCRSVRAFFEEAGIPHRFEAVDADPSRPEGWVAEIRGVMRERTGEISLPQVFVGGRLVGGCQETFEAWKSGELQEALRDCGVAYGTARAVDPYSFLPKWLHPR